MDGIRKFICECIDEDFCLHIVEGHQSLVTIHVYSNAGGSSGDCQVSWGFCSEAVIGLIAQTEEPVAVGWAYSDFAFSINRLACNSQVPVSLSSNFHLEKDSVIRLPKQVFYEPLSRNEVLFCFFFMLK